MHTGGRGGGCGRLSTAEPTPQTVPGTGWTAERLRSRFRHKSGATLVATTARREMWQGIPHVVCPATSEDFCR